MPEEWRMPVAATVSGSDDPKSTGRRSGDPAISTGVSLEGWRRYARYWPWPRGRPGRIRGRRGMSAMEIAQSMSRISGAGPRRGWQRPWGRSPLMMEGMNDEGELTMGPPDMFDHNYFSNPLNWRRVECNITGSAEGAVAVKRLRLAEGAMAVKRPRLAEGAMAVNPQMPREPALVKDYRYFGLEDWDDDWDGKEETSEWKQTPMDVPMATEESKLAEGPVEEHVACKAAKEGVEEPVAIETDGSIATEKPIPAERIVEEPGKDDSEIALGMEEPVAGETGGSVVTEEPRLAEGVVDYSVSGKTLGEVGTEESRPENVALEKPPVKTDAEIAMAKRWLPLCYPDFPSTGKLADFVEYHKKSKMICKLNEAGYERSKNLPTWAVESDQKTKASMKNQDRDICLKAGRSVVAVSSVGPGHDNTFFCCGVIISCDEDGVGTIRVLTSSGILYDDNDVLHSAEQKFWAEIALRCL